MIHYKHCTILYILVLALAACAEEYPEETDSVVFYYSETAETRRVAKLLAEKTGSALFDIEGKQELPDLRTYRYYFVGASIIDNDIALPMQTFLSNADFFDGIVIPFWTGVDDDADYSDLFEKQIYRPRVIHAGGVGGFTGVSLFTMKPVGEQVDALLVVFSEELNVLRDAGERAEAVMKAFAAAYPDRIGEPVLYGGDWTVEMDEERYYYAQGKLLSETEVEQAASFRSQSLSRYVTEFADDTAEGNTWREAAEELFWRRSIFTDRVSRGYGRAASGAVRSNFYEKLLQCETRTEAFAHQQTIRFLGSAVTVHERTVVPLARVEQRINELEKENEEIAVWKQSLDSIGAWNWRNIAGSSSRSFHSYGVAIDLLMKSQPGKETYWLWTQQKGIDFRTVPEEDKLNPPDSVVRIFEDEGFIWGGKWATYDTMHFEYHPELIYLSFNSYV
ncbi:MAG: M15 family metallopeptidase [Treponema sp.]|jgi:hypothetical protein|nr:M15 family metallopeptidase [Treponema sp.]